MHTDLGAPISLRFTYSICITGVILCALRFERHTGQFMRGTIVGAECCSRSGEAPCQDPLLQFSSCVRSTLHLQPDGQDYYISGHNGGNMAGRLGTWCCAWGPSDGTMRPVELRTKQVPGEGSLLLVCDFAYYVAHKKDAFCRPPRSRAFDHNLSLGILYHLHSNAAVHVGHTLLQQ